MHADWSKHDADYGIKYTHITAGKYKAIPNEDEPLNEEGLAYIQDMLNGIWDIFAGDVATNRGMKIADVKKIEGKILLAGPAVEAGLIDRIETDINTFIDYIKSEEESLMDYATLKANHTGLYDQIKAEGAAAEKEKNDAAMKEKIKAAVDSALGVVSAVAGDEVGGKVKTLVDSGINADQVKALKDTLGLQAAKPDGKEQQPGQDAKGKILDALHAATPPAANGGGRQVEGEGLDFEALVDDHMGKHPEVSKGAAMSAMQKKHPDAHKKWLEGKQKK